MTRFRNFRRGISQERTKSAGKFFLLSSILFLASNTALHATAQIGDFLEYEGKTVEIYSTPLEPYLDTLEERPDFGISSTACWRGYVALWKIEEKKLFLVSLHKEDFEANSPLGEEIPLSKVFPDSKSPVEATWYTGALRVPEGERLRYVHMGFGTVYERDRYLTIKKGALTADKVIDNKGFGATRSTADLQWVALAEEPVEDSGDWIDARSLFRDHYKEIVLGGKEVTTRGIFFEAYGSEPATLWIPSSPTTETARIRLIRIPPGSKILSGSHVEITARYVDATGSFRVLAADELEPGKSFHHPDFTASRKEDEEETPNEVRLIADIEFAKPDGVALLLDLHLPEGIKNPPLLMFIHGGGWQKGDRKRCRLSWVAKYGFAVASVEYRLSKEALFPAQIQDCKGALRWLRANAKKYGYDAERVVVGGTSAGGHLAALIGTSGKVAELEGKTGGHLDQSSEVQGIINYYGPSDFVERAKTQPGKCEEPSGSVYRLLGGKVSENLEAARLASPVTHVDEGDPPLLILHGENDKVVKLDQTELLAKRYDETGLKVFVHLEPGASHGWPTTEEERFLVLTSLRKWFSDAD